MNLFRSEEHVERWLAGRTPGITIGVSVLSELAHRWWGDWLDPDWAPRTKEQDQEILDQLGLTDDLWRLA